MALETELLTQHDITDLKSGKIFYILSSQEKSLQSKEVNIHTDTFTQHWLRICSINSQNQIFHEKQ